MFLILVEKISHLSLASFNNNKRTKTRDAVFSITILTMCQLGVRNKVCIFDLGETSPLTPVA